MFLAHQKWDWSIFPKPEISLTWISLGESWPLQACCVSVYAQTWQCFLCPFSSSLLLFVLVNKNITKPKSQLSPHKKRVDGQTFSYTIKNGVYWSLHSTGSAQWSHGGGMKCESACSTASLPVLEKLFCTSNRTLCCSSSNTETFLFLALYYQCLLPHWAAAFCCFVPHLFVSLDKGFCQMTECKCVNRSIHPDLLPRVDVITF